MIDDAKFTIIKPLLMGIPCWSLRLICVLAISILRVMHSSYAPLSISVFVYFRIACSLRLCWSDSLYFVTQGWFDILAIRLYVHFIHQEPELQLVICEWRLGRSPNIHMSIKTFVGKCTGKLDDTSC